MSRWILLFALLALPFVVIAQTDAVQVALDDLNTRLGTSKTLDDLNWRYQEKVYEGNNLSCSYAENTSTEPESIRAHQIEFDINFDDVFEYDYRRSLDGAIFFLCAPLPTATPPPTRVPSLTPDLGPTMTASATSTPSGCGTLPSRLTIGKIAAVMPGLPNNLRDTPGTSGTYVGELPAGATFMVLDGPRCANSLAWWQVEYNGTVGWTIEYLDPYSYALAPLDLLPSEVTQEAPPTMPPVPTIAPIPCSPSLASRLVASEAGRVTPGSPNNVRSRPGTDHDKVGEIPGGGIFVILDGPACADNMAWWYVEYQGLVGWTPEGSDGDYWLEPPFGMLPVITTRNASDLRLLNSTEGDTSGMLEKTLYDEHLLAREVNGFYLYQLFVPFDPQSKMEWLRIASFVDNFTPDTFPLAAFTYTQNVVIAVIRTHYADLYRDQLTQSYTNIYGGLSRDSVFDRHGTRLASVDANGEVFIYDVSLITRRAQPLYSVNPDGTEIMAFTPDSSRLVTGERNIIKVWNGDQLQSTLTAETFTEITQLAFSADSRLLAVAGETTKGGLVYVWSLETWELLASFPLDANAVALSPDGTLVAVAHSEQSLSLYSTRTTQKITELESNGVTQLVFNRTGTALFGLSTGMAHLWAVEE